MEVNKHKNFTLNRSNDKRRGKAISAYSSSRSLFVFVRLLLLITVALLIIPLQAQAAWYDASWSNRQKITILPTLADTDLTNFPYLVKITDPTNPIFSIPQADGDDILFTAADETTKLNHEIELYNPATNELYIWVQVPAISGAVNTDIYMYYGNGSATNQQSVAATWDNDFVMVQHLQETSGTHFDSTSQNNDGTPQNGVVQTATGKIDGADAFDMVDDYVNVPDSTSLRVVSMTLEAWVRIPAPLPASGWHGIINHGNSSNANWYLLTYDGPNNQFHYRWSTGSVRRTNFAATASADTWYYVVGVLDAGTTTAYTYLNGGLDRTITSASLPTATASPLDIGRGLSSELFKGTIDEVRISKIARTPEWISASFRNQNTPDTYQTLSPEDQLISCLVTTTANSGAGSLYECINFANSNPGTTISFNIPGPGNQSAGADSWWRISPTSALPTVTAAGTIIDATTQTVNQGDTNSLGPEVEINGAGTAANTDGLSLTGGGSTVRGLVVNRFTRQGIVAQTAGGNTIAGNYIGVNATGTADLGNGGNGIALSIGNNTIGGLTVADRNVISGNDVAGILFITAPTTNNFVLGNYIGTNAAGTAAIGNTTHGINIASAPGNTIGGTAVGAGNLISGNGGDGISIYDPSSSSNIIQGNLIGTDASGTSPVPNNGAAGIRFWMGADDNRIGGTGTGAGNTIAFNAGDGVYLADANADNNQIIGNAIFSNTGLGIDLDPDGVGTGTGANNDKAAPTITSVTPGGSDFTVVATVTSGDIVEFYRVNNAAAPVVNPDGSGAGEGYLYLGLCVDNGANCSGPHIDTTVTDANAAAGTVQVTLKASGLSGGDTVSATASDNTNGTSEFGVNAAVPAGPCPGWAVTTTADSGVPGTLRECVKEANKFSGITLSVPAGTYTLTITGQDEDAAATGDLDILSQITIQGAGAGSTVIQAGTDATNGIDRVFHLLADTTLSDLTIQFGNLGTDKEGGGIYIDNAAVVNLTDLAVQNNTGKHGGGIYNKDGTLTVTGSTLSGNSAANGHGGGLYHDGGTTATLTNVTFSGNSATGDGGGIYGNDPLTLVNVTLAGNSADKGGGIRRNGGIASLKNTIVANNTAPTGPNCEGTITSAGYNLDSGNSCLFTGTGDQINTDPLLGPLQDNGGPTFTHALELLSPAVDAGTNSGAPALDQRGQPRPYDGDGDAVAVTDTGAYESQQTSDNVSGNVYEDVNGDADLFDKVAAAGVRVRLYADTNDNGIVDAGDTFIREKMTDASGHYSLPLDTATTGLKYLVAVGSKGVVPTGGFNAGFVQGDVWAEQTYGDNPSTAALDLGARIGGRTVGTSDAFNTASTNPANNAYQHLARLDLGGGNVAGVDFAFSFRVISHPADREDDAAANRTAQGTLRQLIQNANAVAGTPTLLVPANTYTLAIAGTDEDDTRTGDLDVTDAVTLVGAGAPTTTINGNAIDRVFHLFANTTFTGVTVQGGNLGTGVEGGGIFIDNAAVVNLTAVAVKNNTGKHGGGIYNKDGTLTVTESTLSENSAANGNGGGLFHDAGTTVILTNVTFSGNSATGDGGGIMTKDPVTLTNVTLANNSANQGGGIRREGGTATFKNTIVANNTAPSSPNCEGTIISAGYNLDSGNSCLFTGTGDQINTDPLLGNLQDNGGPTFTQALLAGSPAIDAGTTTSAPAVDQRGVARGADGDGTPDSPVAGDYDIGAYEGGPLGATIRGTRLRGRRLRRYGCRLRRRHQRPGPAQRGRGTLRRRRYLHHLRHHRCLRRLQLYRPGRRHLQGTRALATVGDAR